MDRWKPRKPARMYLGLTKEQRWGAMVVGVAALAFSLPLWIRWI